MAEISGVEGRILVGGAEIEAADCSLDRDCAVIDRTHFGTLGLPVNAAGQRTGSISASGPVSTTSNLAAKGVTEGALVTFRLRATASLWLEVRGRIGKIGYSNNKDQGPNWTVNATQYGAVTVVGI